MAERDLPKWLKEFFRCQACGKQLEPKEVCWVELPAYSCGVGKEVKLPGGARRVMLCKECVERGPRRIYLGRIEF